MEKKGFWSRFQYQLYFVALYILYLIRYLPTMQELDVYNAAHWFVGYEYGFVSRGFVGQIMNICTDYIWHHNLFIIIFVSLSVMYFLAVHLICKVISKSDEPIKFIIVFLAFLYTVSPAGLAYLFQAINFGRYDMYLIIITLISIALIYKFDNFYLIPVLCVLATMIHPLFVFLYFPGVFALMLYKYKTSSKGSKSQKVTIIITAVVTCILFLYLQIFGKIHSATIYNVTYDMGNKTNVYIHPLPIQLEYFMPLSEHWRPLSDYPLWYRLVGLAGVSVFLSPLIYLLIKIWKGAVKNVQENKFLYLMMSVGIVLATIPVYILAIDWGRWMAGAIMMEFVLIFALVHFKDAAMTASLNSLFEKMKKNYGLYVFIFVITASIGYFVAADFIPLQKDMLDIIDSLTGIISGSQ